MSASILGLWIPSNVRRDAAISPTAPSKGATYATEVIAMVSLRNGRSPSTLASNSKAARWPS